MGDPEQKIAELWMDGTRYVVRGRAIGEMWDRLADAESWAAKQRVVRECAEDPCR